MTKPRRRKLLRTKDTLLRYLTLRIPPTEDYSASMAVNRTWEFSDGNNGHLESNNSRMHCMYKYNTIPPQKLAPRPGRVRGLHCNIMQKN